MHLGSLRLHTHVLVDDADAAFLRHGNGEPGLGDRVHGSRNQRNIEGDVGREPGRQRDVPRQYRRVAGHKQDIVEREGFFDGQRVGRQHWRR